jgi:hypothetical protein
MAGKVHAIHHSHHRYVMVGHRMELLDAVITVAEGSRRGMHTQRSCISPFQCGLPPSGGSRKVVCTTSEREKALTRVCSQNISRALKWIEHEDDSIASLAPAIPVMVLVDHARIR